MAVKMAVEIVGLDKLIRKLDYKLIKEDVDRAVGRTADDAAPMLRTLVGIKTGRLATGITSTGITDRGRGKARGPATSGLSASYVRGIYYGRFPDRGTRYIKRRGWSVKARTQVKPTADQHLAYAGNSIARKWSLI